MSGLPDWLDPLPDAERMRATDAWAIEERGVPSLDLMERAGAACARVAAAMAPDGRIAVLCGKGNNGGDGLVVARLLRDEGREVAVLALGDLNEARGDAAANLARLPGPAPVTFAPEHLAGSALAVDAMLGTGFEGEPREPQRSAIVALAEGDVPVLAVDAPSGVDASTGEVADVAVRATRTVTFHAAKPGLWIAPGKDHAGAVEVADIGIPAGAPGGEAAVGLIRAAVLDAVPKRSAGGSKFASGTVVVCGGSEGLTGAPVMASESAMRAGAGYVTALVPASLGPVFEAKLTEVMTVNLPDEGGRFAADAAGQVLERAEGAGALVLGPGMTRHGGASEVGHRVAQEAAVPLVVDADGLNQHAGELAAFAGRPAPTVLTPHEHELGRLLDADPADVAAHRLACARRAAEVAQAVVVLKGDDSLVAAPDGRVAVSPGGAPGLATAGTGDVLSGVVAAFLAKGMEPWEAACAAVWAHVRAGQIAAERHAGPEGVVATDVIAALPHALAG